MCGIAGFTGFENNIELANLANQVQKHRGPDHQSEWHDGHIALAHQRLSIIDLNERSNQPFIMNNLVIVFNGEIYNFKILKDMLRNKYNAVFRTESDTEVVLQMYYYLKEECLDYLEGMFAFAIYDINNSSLFLARDHFGIKPLFYIKQGNSFAFSSELKTLTGIPGFNKTINIKSLISSLNYYWVSGNESMFVGCYKLPPSHYMKISKDLSQTLKAYWEINDKEKSNVNEKIIKEKLYRTIDDSVHRHMLADVPVSSFLSGGLDSSLISVLAKQYNPTLSTYTIGTEAKDKKFEKMPEDEFYAKKLSDEFKLEYNEITVTPDIINILPQIIYYLDEPIGEPSAINTYLICKAFREKNGKVILSGMGADEIFLGYRRQKALLLSFKYQKLPGIIRKIINYICSKLPVKIFGRGIRLTRWIKRFLTFADMPPEAAYMRSYSHYSKDELKVLFNQKHTEEIEKLYEEHGNIFRSKYKNDIANQMCHTDIHMFMVGLNLSLTDKASMAASVEVRVPFIDKTVIENAMAIPGKLKYRKRQSKYILKKAAEKILPKTIIYRPKAAFTAPMRSWISNDLKNMVDDLLSESIIKKRGLFNYDFIKKLIDDDRKGLSDNAHKIYQLLTVELWFREYIDKHV